MFVHISYLVRTVLHFEERNYETRGAISILTILLSIPLT